MNREKNSLHLEIFAARFTMGICLAAIFLWPFVLYLTICCWSHVDGMMFLSVIMGWIISGGLSYAVFAFCIDWIQRNKAKLKNMK